MPLCSACHSRAHGTDMLSLLEDTHEKAGQHIGNPPYGYRWERKDEKMELVMHEREQEIVGIISRLARAIPPAPNGRKTNCHRIATILNRAGLRTRRRARWRSVQVMRVLLRAGDGDEIAETDALFSAEEACGIPEPVQLPIS